MITMKQLGKIRRWYYPDGLTLPEIARKSGLARNTVKNWLKAAEGTEPKYRRSVAETKVAPFEAQLVKMLETDARPEDGAEALRRDQGGRIRRRLQPRH